jgi:hypothetical protein
MLTDGAGGPRPVRDKCSLEKKNLTSPKTGKMRLDTALPMEVMPKTLGRGAGLMVPAFQG